MLRDLTIQNYRCFQEFQIDDLARVNLIVGGNNTGKTSLLEAIYLYVTQNHPSSLVSLLENRGEISRLDSSPVNLKYQISDLFYGQAIITPDKAIAIDSIPDKSPAVTIKIVRDLQEIISEQAKIFSTYKIRFLAGENTVWELDVIESGAVKFNSAYRSTMLELGRDDLTANSILIPTDNLSAINLNKWWDAITLTPKEEKVVKALQIIEPKAERINFTSSDTANKKILLKLRGASHPITLSSMGDGMRRLLMLAMATVTVENGVLLVDEIDTGLHYQTQTDMWRLILETGQQLNVQVFATTHSWDCICAFQEALEQLEDNSVGKLFRLSRRDDTIKPVAYTADELNIAIPHSIEVR
ncbi:MAG: AAA family ATPase [Hormoscilla sp. GUM202]|nr:AAA family ATPase [Hormoscilla sp. GUM202]